HQPPSGGDRPGGGPRRIERRLRPGAGGRKRCRARRAYRAAHCTPMPLDDPYPPDTAARAVLAQEESVCRARREVPASPGRVLARKASCATACGSDPGRERSSRASALPQTRACTAQALSRAARERIEAGWLLRSARKASNAGAPALRGEASKAECAVSRPAALRPSPVQGRG